ncbi:MAG: membrane protein insertion efficiency factor YidD [Pseudomonadota bacterium]|nr:membrane protein insertion efficiency factor YidD [Pseudomonadota bacterium]
MKAVLIGLIRVYQVLTAWTPSSCRYVPSCSAYAREAIEVHGAGPGAALAVRRILRCHPWRAGGNDPVPPRTAIGRPG